MIFETREKLREQEEQSTKLTKSARRSRERRILHQTPLEPPKTLKPAQIEDADQTAENTTASQNRRRIRPFDELEEID